MLPASSLARRPEPLTARHTAGALRGCASWPGVAASSRLLPPPPAVQFPVQLSAIPDGGLLGGTTCLGGLGAQRGPGPPQSPTWPSTVTHQPRAPRPSRRGRTPPGVLWNLLHVTQIPSDPARPAPSRPPWWSGHSHGAGDTCSARPRPTGWGYQGEDRLGQAQHLQVPCRAALRLPQGGLRGADRPPHILDTKQEPTVRAGGRRGRLPGTQGSDWPVALLAVCLRSSRPRGAPRPTRALCGVAFHTLPCLPSLAFSPNSKCPAASHGPLPPAPERVLGPQTLPPRPLPPALS